MNSQVEKSHVEEKVILVPSGDVVHGHEGLNVSPEANHVPGFRLWRWLTTSDLVWLDPSASMTYKP